jgi:chromosome segregation ATPase
MVTKARGKSDGRREGGEWIENELRETKARLHKVESELAQALKQTYSLDTDLRKLMESLAVTGSVEAALQGFREEVRQMRDALSRVHDRQSAITGRMEQIQNQRQAEVGRDRHDMGVVVKQVDALNRVIEQSDGRMKALEEIVRHVEEEVAGNRLTNQAIERTMEELNTRSARTHEAAMRLDQEVGRHTGEIEKLDKSDDNMVDKMTLFLEQLRRALERLDKVEQLNDFPEQVRDSLDKATFERDQLNDRVAAMERLAGEIAERTDEFVQSLARLDQRSQQHAGELLSQAGQLQDLTHDMKTGLKKIYQLQLRQRRRASEALNQEIKELTQGELHAGD